MVEDYVVNIPKESLVLCRFWDEECVIYNLITGETHLIDGMGAEIYKLVSEKTATRARLLQYIHSIFELEIDFDVEGFLDNLILQYQKLGLLAVMENSPA